MSCVRVRCLPTYLPCCLQLFMMRAQLQRPRRGTPRTTCRASRPPCRPPSTRRRSTSTMFEPRTDPRYSRRGYREVSSAVDHKYGRSYCTTALRHYGGDGAAAIMILRRLRYRALSVDAVVENGEKHLCAVLLGAFCLLESGWHMHGHSTQDGESDGDGDGCVVIDL